MIKKEITLCSKQVTLAYCYATEIAYKDLADEDMLDYAKQSIAKIQENQDPDVKRSILAIIACMMAYYQDSSKAPVSDTDIMRDATPKEIITAIFAILNMRAEFYHIPSGESEESDGDSAPKNA